MFELFTRRLPLLLLIVFWGQATLTPSLQAAPFVYEDVNENWTTPSAWDVGSGFPDAGDHVDIQRSGRTLSVTGAQSFGDAGNDST